jgi:hypothetical protein
MPAIMRKKVRSYLKGLAENRARAVGEVIRFEGMIAEVTQRLAESDWTSRVAIASSRSTIRG